MSIQDIQVVAVMPTFLQESGLSVFTAMTSPEYSIQVSQAYACQSVRGLKRIYDILLLYIFLNI
jgi:hypothetical protein